MRVRVALTALSFWLTTAVYTVAFAQRPGSGGGGGGGGGSPRPGGGGASAPEIDGPGGVAAIALLVGAGMIAYKRYKRK